MRRIEVIEAWVSWWCGEFFLGSWWDGKPGYSCDDIGYILVYLGKVFSRIVNFIIVYGNIIVIYY